MGGGEDFDQRVMQYFIKQMKKQKSNSVDISNNKRALQKLRKEVERVKRALSSQTQARLEIEDIVPGHDFQETLTRANVEKSEVDHIVLVGGSTRIPRVQELLSEY